MFSIMYGVMSLAVFALATWLLTLISSWIHMFKGNMSSDDNDDRDDVGGNDNIKVEDE